MSYLENPSFYTNEPSAYARPDFDSRVPGWGPVRHAAGPSMWGVGAVAAQPAIRQKMAAVRTVASPIASKRIIGGSTTTGTAATAESGGIPWWVWVAVPMALGGIGLIAYDMGWFGD